MSDLFEFLCRMGDNSLILGQRLSEWCGHGPALEEDIALANTALDLIGQTQMWLGYAAEVEGKGRSADDLAMRRDVWDFRNVLLVEQPNGDYGQTMMRQYLFDRFHLALLRHLCASTDQRIADIAAKAVKEVSYHLDRSRGLVIALGDGTDLSHAKMQTALDRLWPFVGEMFEADPVSDALTSKGIAPDPEILRQEVMTAIREDMGTATLTAPESEFAHSGGKTGKRHSEHLGHVLATMQFLPRSYPDAQW